MPPATPKRDWKRLKRSDPKNKITNRKIFHDFYQYEEQKMNLLCQNSGRLLTSRFTNKVFLRFTQLPASPHPWSHVAAQTVRSHIDSKPFRSHQLSSSRFTEHKIDGNEIRVESRLPFPPPDFPVRVCFEDELQQKQNIIQLYILVIRIVQLHSVL